MEEDGRGSALPFLLVWRARLCTRRELYSRATYRLRGRNSRVSFWLARYDLVLRRELLRKPHGTDHAFAFFYEEQLIRFRVFDGVHLAAGPADFEQINFLRLPQAEVNPQIVL